MSFVPRNDVRAYFLPLVNSSDLAQRAKAIRALMADMKGGRCNECGDEIDDYLHLTKWHFDHLADIKHYKVSPKTGLHQFRISGNDIAKRSFALVTRHCQEDTQLLCKDCHFHKTMATYNEDQRVANLARHARDLGMPLL